MNRITRLGRMASTVLSHKPETIVKAAGQPIRHGGAWTYRSYAISKNKNFQLMADLLGTAVWFWVMYHFYYESEHISGEFLYPDPSKWTDKELGIPPDDEE